MKNEWPLVPLGDLLRASSDVIPIEPGEEYREVTVKLWGKGVVLRRVAYGSEIGATKRFRVREGQFILSRIDARHGAFGLVPPDLDGAVVSNDFPAYDCTEALLHMPYLAWFSKTERFVDICNRASKGTTNRVRLKEGAFLASTIPLPSLSEQRRIVALLDRISSLREEHRAAGAELEILLAAALSRAFRGEL